MEGMESLGILYIFFCCVIILIFTQDEQCLNSDSFDVRF